MRLNNIIVSIGSNIEQRDEEVSRALVWLRQFMPSSLETSPYTTQAEAFDENISVHSTYLNAVVRGVTPFSVEKLCAKFKAYERLRGRMPEHKEKGRVIIDIDIVVFDNKIINQKEYDSPHFCQGLERLH